jgi:hypothetical protein
MKSNFEINPIVIKETKKSIWTYHWTYSMNETSKFKVKSCRPRTMVFQALTFDIESWGLKGLGFEDSTIGTES